MPDGGKYGKYLARGEELITVFGIGDRYFWTNAIFFFVLSLVLVGLPFLLKLVRLRHALKYILTDRRVIVKDGVFSVRLESAPFDHISHIEVNQDFFSKMSYGVGDITIHTTGRTPIEIKLIKVHEPIKVKNLIEELISKDRSLLGMIHDPLVKPLRF